MSIAVTGLYEGFSGPRDIPANGKRKSVPDPLAVQMQGLASDWSMIRNGMPSGCAAIDGHRFFFEPNKRGTFARRSLFKQGAIARYQLIPNSSREQGASKAHHALANLDLPLIRCVRSFAPGCDLRSLMSAWRQNDGSNLQRTLLRPIVALQVRQTQLLRTKETPSHACVASSRVDA